MPKIIKWLIGISIAALALVLLGKAIDRMTDSVIEREMADMSAGQD